MLLGMGAQVSGLALEPAASPNLFDLLDLSSRLDSTIGDIRDEAVVRSVFARERPEFVFHLAAQSLVRAGYHRPQETFSTNVMGTVNVLEAVRNAEGIRSAVIVTTDKCYENQEWLWAYRESDRLGGKDPYSSSKAAAELATFAYRMSFESMAPIATARAGNVIGGGDWSTDRLVPDIVVAAMDSREPVLRYPLSVRPWQHVLEPLSGYLTLAERLDRGADASGAWNFGPESQAAVTVAELAESLLTALGRPPRWTRNSVTQPPEARLLRVDSTRARELLGWRSKLGESETIAWTARWYQAWMNGSNMLAHTQAEITEYAAL